MSNKQRPILFSTAMVQNILDGRKTQTRRVAKEFESFENMDKLLARFPNQEGCPYGKPSDILWVRETWAKSNKGTVIFRADATDETGQRWHSIAKGDPNNEVKWKPSIHMPLAAARIFLRIKSVRVERLQEISEADAIAEGVTDFGKQEFHPIWTAKKAFKSIWQSINGPESWDANPWVWVVEFERISREEALNVQQ